MDRREKVLAGIAALVLLTGVGVGVYKALRPRFEGSINALAVDLSAP